MAKLYRRWLVATSDGYRLLIADSYGKQPDADRHVKSLGKDTQWKVYDSFECEVIYLDPDVKKD